jgi:hypothetical protein
MPVMVEAGSYKVPLEILFLPDRFQDNIELSTAKGNLEKY